VLLPAIVFAIVDGFSREQLLYGLGTAGLHSFYAVFLTRSYTEGDLSSVYPVSRGVGPALVPVLAVVLLNESISTGAVIGIVLVVMGIYTIHIDARLIRDLSHPIRALAAPGTRIAFLTGLVIALYSIWDKAGIDHGLHPMILNAFSIGSYFLILTPFVGASGGGGVVPTEVRSQWRRIVTAGILAPSGYLLVLIALESTRVSYIAPTREVGIVLGAAMGVLLLGEGYGLSRIWGAMLVVLGVAVIGLSP
jgi:uncharacterized membrane protein